MEQKTQTISPPLMPLSLDGKVFVQAKTPEEWGDLWSKGARPPLDWRKASRKPA